ncbi:MAG: metallophosphoesterase family protein [Solitalea sp.]
MRIGLLSDTHSFLDPSILTHFRECDEIWHAGDFGNARLADELAAFKPLKGVYGNIDGQDVRVAFPETAIFECEGVKVLMKHIGGYPGRYAPGVRPLLETVRPLLFISGHSHILKVVYDKKLGLLHINPGAAGKEGFHRVRTITRFTITGERIHDLEVIELGNR